KDVVGGGRIIGIDEPPTAVPPNAFGERAEVGRNDGDAESPGLGQRVAVGLSPDGKKADQARANRSDLFVKPVPLVRAMPNPKVAVFRPRVAEDVKFKTPLSIEGDDLAQEVAAF